MQWIQLNNPGIEISATPVDWQAYERFAQETMRVMPRRTESSLPNFVTGVSATDASAFAQWISLQTGGFYRLPTLGEILALFHQAANGGHIWPRRFWNGMDRPVRDYFYEWLDCSPDRNETDDQNGTKPRCRCVTHPAWCFAQPPRPMRAALADTAYPFVVFRMVRSQVPTIDPLCGGGRGIWNSQQQWNLSRHAPTSEGRSV